MSAKLLTTRELAAELTRRFMYEAPFELIALARVRSGKQLPPDREIMRGIAAFARAQTARGVKTVREAKYRSAT